jgi:hypothetical protein
MGLLYEVAIVDDFLQKVGTMIRLLIFLVKESDVE